METLLLDPSKGGDIEKAGEIIRGGGLVAFPTETVYGLGGSALDENAALKIFMAKGRPQDNPLISHISKISDMDKYCVDIPALAYALAEKFWPGPMTMILPRGELIPKRVTAGLDTAAIRCPSNLTARALIDAAGVPIAAPSANLSGRPSTTTAAHVIQDLWGRVEAIIDGGDCEIGLESTVIDVSNDGVRILRPGGITAEMLKTVTPNVVIDSGLVTAGTPKSPGMKYRHYAPRAVVTAYCGDPDMTAEKIKSDLTADAAVLCYDEYKSKFDCLCLTYGKTDDMSAHAHLLFDALREFDEHPEVKYILAQCPDDRGVGLAVSNRLKKAAGFKIVNV